MGIYEFNILPEDKQWNTLWDKGKFLTNLKLIDKSFSLHAIDKFFVEVELAPLTDKIIGKKVFKFGHCMDKYSGDLGFKRPTQ